MVEQLAVLLCFVFVQFEYNKLKEFRKVSEIIVSDSRKQIKREETEKTSRRVWSQFQAAHLFCRSRQKFKKKETEENYN